MSDEKEDATYEEDKANYKKRLEQSKSILAEAQKDDRAGQTLLGTFMGVFVPTTQNILGIILFIRLPFITAQAGIFQAATIVGLSCFSSMLTSLSMSGIATNGKVTAGGCYQIIKKSLGNEFGGVVGILLFLSNNFGVAMYVLGFVEALRGASDDMTFFGRDEDGELKDKLNDNRIIGFFTLTFLASIVYVGISYISKFALLFLSGVLLAIFSIFLGDVVHSFHPDVDKGVVGISSENFKANWGPEYQEWEGKDYSYAVLLALFYPAVTDPLAGSNLSGDLKDAAGSIPPGTLAAVAFTTLIFLSQVIITGACTDRTELLTNSLIVTDVAWPVPHIIYAGIMLSTLGAGLQSLAGAPRLLAAISKDDLIPILRPLVPAAGQEPRRIVLLCYVLSMSVLMLGELNAVAPFITMWFLTCYSIINGASFILAFDSSPGFRPTWKYFHWSTSLLGSLICLGMMFFIYWEFALAALFFAFFLYKFMQRQANMKLMEAEKLIAEGGAEITADMRSRADWASTMRFSNCRKALLALKEHDVEFKYWRPFILFLCKISEEDGSYVPQAGMINLISQLMKRGKGMSFVAGVVKGEFTAETARKTKESTKLLAKTLKEKGVDGFPEVVVASSIAEGQRFMIQGKGFGVLRPNTVMMGFPSNLEAMSEKAKGDYVAVWRDAAVSGKTLLVCKGTIDFPSSDTVLTGNVDVWWVFDILPARGLLILIPYLLQQSKVWKGTKLRLFVVTGFEEQQTGVQLALETMLKAAGIKAQVHVLQMDAKDAPRYTHMLEVAPLVDKVPSESQAKDLFQLNPALSGISNVGSSGQEDDPGHPGASTHLHDEITPSPMLDNLGGAEDSTTSDMSGITEFLSKVAVNMEVSLPEEVKSPRTSMTDEGTFAAAKGISEADVTLKEESGGVGRPLSHLHPRDKTAKAAYDRRSSNAQVEADVYGSRLTAAFRRYSSESALTLIALPKKRKRQTPQEYLDSLHVLIKDLHRVIMVQESGYEKVQLYG